MNPTSDQDTLERILQYLAHGSEIIPLIGRIGYDGRLAGLRNVTQAIVAREKSIASSIEKSPTPWVVIHAVSWVPGLLNIKRIRKSIGNAFISTEYPWYVLNALKANREILLTHEVKGSIFKALGSSKRFWLFLDHLKNLQSLIQDDEVRKLIKKHAHSIPSQLIDSSSPLSMLQSIKYFPELFAQEQLKAAILEVIKKNEKPWEFLQELKSIEPLDYLQSHPQIHQILEEKAQEIVSQMEKFSDVYGTMKDLITIPELARTKSIRRFFCKLVSTKYESSSYLGMLSSNEELANNPECQEAVARAIIAASEPHHLISSASYSQPLLSSPALEIAIMCRLEDLVTTIKEFPTQDLQKTSSPISFAFDIVAMLKNIPSIQGNKEVEEAVAEYIATSNESHHFISRAIEKTSFCKRTTIQEAIAEAIRRSSNPLDLITEIEDTDYLIRSDAIREAIRVRAQDVLESIKTAKSIKLSGAISSIIHDDAVEDAFVTRLLESEHPADVLKEIFRSHELAKSKIIHEGIARYIQESENPFKLLEHLTRFTSFDERWRALMDRDVLDVIANLIETTISLQDVLRKIGWAQFKHLLFTHEPIEQAIRKRLNDFVELIEEGSRLSDLIDEISKIPILASNNKVIGAIAKAIKNPCTFRSVMENLYSMKNNPVILKAMEEAGDNLLLLLNKEKSYYRVLRDAYHPIMLNNDYLIDWFIEHIEEEDILSTLLNRGVGKNIRLHQRIIRMMREAEPHISFHIASSLFNDGFLEKFPEYRKEFEALFADEMKNTEVPWDSRYISIITRFDSSQITNIVRKRIPDIAQGVYDLDSKATVICSAAAIDEWFTNEEIINAIANNIHSLDYSALLCVTGNINLISQEPIWEALKRLILETSKVTYTLSIIFSDEIHSSEDFQKAILSRMSDIAREIKESDEITRTLHKLEKCRYLIEYAEIQDAISQRMEDIIGKISNRLYFGVKDCYFIDLIVLHPKVYNLILQLVQESDKPWDIIGVIGKNQCMMKDEKILQAIAGRIQFIAKALEKLENPDWIYRQIKDTKIIAQDSLIRSAITARGLEVK